MWSLRIYIIFSLCTISFGKLQYAHFFHEFLRDKPITSTFTLNICWSYDEIKKLALELYSAKIPISINTNLNITHFPKFSGHTNYIVVDINCHNARHFLEIANSTDAYKFPYKWILIETYYKNDSKSDMNFAMADNNSFEGSCREYVKDLNILVDSELTCVVKFKNKLLLWQYYLLTAKNTLVRERYGEWSKDNGFKVYYKYNVTSFRRKDLQGTALRIVFVIDDNDTFNHLDDFRYPMADMLTKAQYGSMQCLLYYLNSTYTTVVTTHYGVKTESGLWNGLSGELEQKRADITGSGMYFFKERLEFAKYVTKTNPSRISFIFRKPPLSFEQNIYSLPFTISVWISIMFLILIFGFFLIISSNLENPRNEVCFLMEIIEAVYYKFYMFKDKDKVDIGNIILLLFAALCQQGCDIVPSGVPGRILTLLVFTALMFLYVAYSANIVVLLQSTSENIKTKEDILKSRLKVGANDVSYNRYYFLNAKDPVKKAIYDEKMAPNGFYNLSEGIEKVRQGLFAFHVEHGAAFYYILKTFHEHEKCECSSVRGIIEAELGWVSCANDTAYFEMFRIGLVKAGEYGMEQRCLRRFYSKLKCTHVAASFTSVGIIDFYPAILVYFYGVGCALFVFILEHILYKYSKIHRFKENRNFSTTLKSKKILPVKVRIDRY